MPCEPGSQSSPQKTKSAGSAPSDGSDMRPNYLSVSIPEAIVLKWRVGQAIHGPVFKTNPLVELDEELLDAMNYVAEAERQGYRMGDLAERFYALCVEVRDIIRRSGDIDSKTANGENG